MWIIIQMEMIATVPGTYFLLLNAVWVDIGIGERSH